MGTRPENYVYCKKCKRRCSWLKHPFCARCLGGNKPSSKQIAIMETFQTQLNSGEAFPPTSKDEDILARVL